MVKRITPQFDRLMEAAVDRLPRTRGAQFARFLDAAKGRGDINFHDLERPLDPNKQALLFFGGILCNGNTMVPLAREFASEYEVVIVNGASPRDFITSLIALERQAKPIALLTEECK